MTVDSFTVPTRHWHRIADDRIQVRRMPARMQTP